MTWNHRIVKKVFDDGTEIFGIHEAFYNDKGEIYGYTSEPIEVSCESVEALHQTLEWMLKSLEKPVLIDGQVEFAKE